MEELLVCQFCGHKESIKDIMDLGEDGFWCDYCDGFTYYNNSKAIKHNFFMILEKGNANTKVNYNKTQNFNKRISPLRYPGSKSKLIDYIYSKLNKKNIECFIEPFAGGASVGLSLLEAKVINKLVINDIDFGIYSLFSIIKEDPSLLIKKIMSKKPTHVDFFYSRDKVKNHYKNCDKMDAAWSLLITNRLSYSGILKANPLGGKNGCEKDLLSRWNPNDLCKRISLIHSMADSITILNKDALNIIEEYYWRPNATIFVDPPYFEKGKQLYINYYQEKDHIKLELLLDNLYKGCPGADVILTYDNNKFINDLYLFPEKEKIKRLYSA